MREASELYKCTCSHTSFPGFEPYAGHFFSSQNKYFWHTEQGGDEKKQPESKIKKQKMLIKRDNFLEVEVVFR